MKRTTWNRCLSARSIRARDEAIQVQTAQATQAAVEGSQRGVAATAGQVQQVASEAQAEQRTKMAEDLFNLEAATAEEASRLRDIGVNLDLAEAEGAQMAAADAARARSQAIQQGIEGVGNTVQAGLSLVPLYQKQGRVLDRLQWQKLSMI